MSSSKPLIYVAHARLAIRERDLDRAWIERTALDPEWVESDPLRAGTERRFRAIPERDGRILRVAVVETAEEIRIVTAFLDRRARRPK